MGPFFSQLPLSYEKAQTMEWDCQELQPHAPNHHGQGKLRELTAHHKPTNRSGA